jgi:hypothetical protein
MSHFPTKRFLLLAMKKVKKTILLNRSIWNKINLTKNLSNVNLNRQIIFSHNSQLITQIESNSWQGELQNG